jgi:hypothetical protein
MAADLAVPPPNAEDLPPPPRLVPLALWCHLLAAPWTLGGAGLFAFGMVFAIIFAGATDPVGLWRLSRRRHQAPGWLEAVTPTSFHEGGGDGDSGTPIYRCDYSFALPDGTPMRGRSYTLGQQFQLPPPAPGGPAPWLRVVVEFDPEHPGTNRIQGTRTSPYTPGALFVLVFPAAGLGATLGGLVAGRRRGRLLRDGEFAQATVTGCAFGAGEDSTYLPVPEFRNRLAGAGQGFAVNAVLTFSTGYLALWAALATAFLVFGTVFCVVALVVILFVFPMPPRERSLFALAFFSFLVLWVTMGSFMARSGWQAFRAVRRRGELPTPPVVRCAFEFRPPDGEVVQAKSPGRLAGWSGAEPPQAALYDPARPTRAVLLSGLAPGVRVGPTGAWETSAGLGAVLRVLVILLLLTGPFVAWVFLPGP